MFTIKTFDDYHEITDWKRPGTVVRELGCFMRRNTTCGYCEYFAVRWKRGEKPTRAQVLKRLETMVDPAPQMINGFQYQYTRNEVVFR